MIAHAQIDLEPVTNREAFPVEGNHRGESLQALTRRLLGVQEAERCQLAHELQHEMAQTLTALKYQAAVLRRSSPAAGQDSFDKLDALIEQLVGRLQGLSLRLRPPMLDDLGLVPALVWYCNLYTDQTGVPVDFLHQGISRRFAPELETTVFRVVQELLAGLQPRTCGRPLSLRLVASETLLTLQITHDCTLDDGALLHRAGLNRPVSVHERVSWLGGQTTVEVLPTGGTRLMVRLPLAPAPSQRQT